MNKLLTFRNVTLEKVCSTNMHCVYMFICTIRHPSQSEDLISSTNSTLETQKELYGNMTKYSVIRILYETKSEAAHCCYIHFQSLKSDIVSEAKKVHFRLSVL